MTEIRDMAHYGAYRVTHDWQLKRQVGKHNGQNHPYDVEDGGSIHNRSLFSCFSPIEYPSSRYRGNCAISNLDGTSTLAVPSTLPIHPLRRGRESSLTTWTTQTPQPEPRSQPAGHGSKPFIARLRRVKTSVSDLARRFRSTPRPQESTTPTPAVGATTVAARAQNHQQQLGTLDFSLFQRRTQAQIDLSEAEDAERSVSAILPAIGTTTTATTVTTATTAHASTVVEGVQPATSSISGSGSATEKAFPQKRLCADKEEQPITHASQAYVLVQRDDGRDHVFDEGEAMRIRLQAEGFEKLHRYDKVGPPQYLETTLRDADMYRRQQARPCDRWSRLHGSVGVPDRRGGTGSAIGGGGERASRKEEILRESEREVLRGPEEPGVYVPVFRRRKSKKSRSWLRRKFAMSGKKLLERVDLDEEPRSRDEVTVSTREVDDYDSDGGEWYVEYKKVRAALPLEIWLKRMYHESTAALSLR